MSKNIIILGAGYGGVAAAKQLNKQLKKQPEATITLIDNNPFHTLLTEIHEVAGNRIGEEDVQIGLGQIFESTRVNVVQDYIEEIDFENKSLSSAEYKYNYDYLIIGTGSKPTDCGVEGVEENTFTLWSIEDAVAIREHVVKMFEKARITDDPELRKELLTFVVCGGGFTGVEMVGELIEWFDDLTKQYQVPRDEIELILCEGLERILPNLDEDSVAKAMKFLNKHDVKVKTGLFVTRVAENRLIMGENDEVNSATIIWTCGVQASELAAKAELEAGPAERIVVNEYLQTTKYPEVYAVGDNAAAPWHDDDILPALVEAAMQTGECAAHNIAADIKGTPKEEIEPKLHGVMVSIGGDFAVAEVMGLSLKGRPAMMMKHMVNMHYLFEVGGIKEGCSLIKDYVKEQASEKGLVAQAFDHISQATPALFLVPLRIFVGIMWLLSGLDKIENGWLAAGDKLVAGASTSPIGPDAVGWYVDIMETFIFPNAYFFQIIITMTEFALAVSLILGLFSTLGAIGSVGMSINFFLAGFGIQNPELKWYLFSSIALLCKAGHSFGLDYYVFPWLKRIIWRRPKEKNDDLKQVVEIK